MAMARVLVGDCREVMAGMEPDSVDAVVCDPPYEISFMSRSWDGRGVAFDPATWRAVFRVLKPGARLLAFGGTRTYHRMVCAIEDAGFEIEDTVMWLHGQGFPKHGSKLKPACEPICVAWKPAKRATELNIDACRIGTTVETWPKSRNYASGNMREPGVIKNGQTEGTGDAPAGRYPANVILSHTEACREIGVRRVKGNLGSTRGGRASTENYRLHHETGQAIGYADPDGYETVAAWECAEHCPIAILDAQSGERSYNPGKTFGKSSGGKIYANGNGIPSGADVYGYGDTGGASRFFLNVAPDDEAVRFAYVPKSSRRERNAGLEGMPERKRKMGGHGNDEPDGLTQRLGSNEPAANYHPTVKPLALMRWLVRLVTPTMTSDGKPGIVLDPFLGSGTTLMACVLEGFDGIGIEQDEAYAEIARRRIAQVETYGERWLEAAGKVDGSPRPAPFSTTNSRECNVCGTRAKQSGPGGRWPNCEHDDWRWAIERGAERAKPAPALTDLPLFAAMGDD